MYKPERGYKLFLRSINVICFIITLVSKGCVDCNWQADVRDASMGGWEAGRWFSLSVKGLTALPNTPSSLAGDRHWLGGEAVGAGGGVDVRPCHLGGSGTSQVSTDPAAASHAACRSSSLCLGQISRSSRTELSGDYGAARVAAVAAAAGMSGRTKPNPSASQVSAAWRGLIMSSALRPVDFFLNTCLTHDALWQDPATRKCMSPVACKQLQGSGGGGGGSSRGARATGPRN